MTTLQHMIGIVRHSTLVVDATGVGAPVVDMLRRADLPCRLMPVTITGGEHDAPVQAGIHVPKRELLTGLQVLVQSRGLQIPRKLMLADALIREMVGMKEASQDDWCWRFRWPGGGLGRREAWRVSQGRLV